MGGEKIVTHRRDAENAKKMNIFLSAERAERKKLMFYNLYNSI